MSEPVIIDLPVDLARPTELAVYPMEELPFPLPMGTPIRYRKSRIGDRFMSGLFVSAWNNGSGPLRVSAVSYNPDYGAPLMDMDVIDPQLDLTEPERNVNGEPSRVDGLHTGAEILARLMGADTTTGVIWAWDNHANLWALRVGPWGTGTYYFGHRVNSNGSLSSSGYPILRGTRVDALASVREDEPRLALLKCLRVKVAEYKTAKLTGLGKETACHK